MKRHYEKTFKQKLANLYSAGILATTICKVYSIPRSTLYSWIHSSKKPKINKSTLISARELDLLRKRLNSAEKENEILKECNRSRMSSLDKKVKAIAELFFYPTSSYNHSS